MRISKISLVLIIASALSLFFYRAPVNAEETTLRMTIMPLQCNIERIHDGIQEVVRITPEACQRAAGLLGIDS